MAQIKGIPRKQSQYATHNYCTHCGEWREGKPLFCPECNKFCRRSVRRVNGHYTARDVARY